MLTGFKEMQLLTGNAFLSLSKNGVAFNKNVIIKMQYPNNIKILINDKENKIAIQAVNYVDDKTLDFFHEGMDVKKGVRYNNRELINTISGMMSWDLNDSIFRVDGVYSDEDKAMIFDLNLARKFSKRKRSNK